MQLLLLVMLMLSSILMARTAWAAAPDVAINIVSDTPTYDNGDVVTYTVTVANTSGATVSGLTVKDLFSGVLSGGEKAFSATEITAQATTLSSAGTFATGGDLNATNVHIRNGGSVVYTIKATVSTNAIGTLTNTASVEDATGVALSATPVSMQRVVYQATTDMKASAASYSPDGTLTYTLTVTNKGTAPIKNMSVDDMLMDIKTMDINGNTVAAFTSNSITATASGSDSNAGTFAASGNLQAKGVSLAVGGFVTYTLQAKIADLLVNNIENLATAETRDNFVNTPTITTPSALASIALTNTLNKSGSYNVGDDFSYTVVVKNTGAGIAYNYHVKDAVQAAMSQLANDPAINLDSTDTTGKPFLSWKNSVSAAGAKSLSSLKTAGGSADTDLDDVVSVYPGESITYTVDVSTRPVSIGLVPALTASVLKNDDSQAATAASGTLSAAAVIDSNGAQISRTKVTNDTDYKPGQDVTYTILVKNSDPKLFADNIKLMDNISCIKAQKADGSTSAAFTRWKLDVAKSDGAGTKAGSFAYGSWKTDDVLSVVPDIAPGGSVQYTLTATVASNTTGLLLDNGSCLNDNVSEGDAGLEMPKGALAVKKTVDSSFYSAGSMLTYTITVSNPGEGYSLNVPVKDDLAAITTTDIYGNTIPAYSSWTITGAASKADGSASTDSTTGLTGPLNNPSILDTTINLAPGDKVVYTVQAVVAPTANGEIKNAVTLDNNIYSDTGSKPRNYVVTLNKSVNGADHTGYTRGDDTLTWTVVVSNALNNGFAPNVHVDDVISGIQAELLEPKGKKKQAFTSWTIAAKATSTNPNPDALKVTDVGKFSDNTDLHAIAQIPPGVTITYTIVGTLDRTGSPNEIVWGNVDNTATANMADINQTVTDTAQASPESPDLLIEKTVLEGSFTPGSTLTYHVHVTNRGPGYANDAAVKDDIAGIGAFSSWKITASTDTLGGTTTGTFADNQNINTVVDVAPGGFVDYTVTGIVKSDYTAQEISNTATLHDPLTNRDFSSSAVVSQGDQNFGVDIVKTGDSMSYTPGGLVTYTIKLTNTSDKEVPNLTLVDNLSKIRSSLANKQDSHFADYPAQSPFESWRVDYGQGYGEYGNVDINEPITLAAKEVRTILVQAKVKDNALDKIVNDAYIYKDRGEATEQSRVSHYEYNRAGSGGTVTHAVNTNRYAPGDTLTYTITASSQVGYYNNVAINEKINEIQVKLLDGTTGNPYYNPATKQNEFTVTVKANDTHAGGTIDGTADGTVEDNKDIVTTLDVGPKDTVVYTVQGKIRPDAIGNIDYAGTTVIPEDYHLNASKTTEETNYSPGKPISYHLRISNDGKGNAYAVPVKDAIDQVMATSTDGKQVPAFTSWTITPTATGSQASYMDPGTYADNQPLDTVANIPAGVTLDYKVVAVTKDNLVGSVINQLQVDTSKVSTSTSPAVHQLDYAKTILAYYDTDGTTKLSGGYTPGGYVEYEIRLTNTGDANISGLTVEDDIGAVKTTYLDGSRGPAFDSWTIKTQKDASSVSQPGTVADNQALNTTAKIAYNNYPGVADTSYVSYVIKAKINANAVGDFKNVANADDGRLTMQSDTSTMLPSSVALLKKAYSDSGYSQVKTDYDFAGSDNKVYYRITLTNSGKGTDYGNTVKDVLSALKTEVAESGTTSGSAPTDVAFSDWTVTPVVPKDSVTDIGGFTGGSNVDINAPLVIAAGETVQFDIAGTLTSTALGSFSNSASYAGKTSSASLTPLANDTTITKTLVSVGGKAWSKGNTYTPGDKVVYKVVVTNNSNGWANNIQIVDTLSNVTTALIGGTIGPAFSSTHITSTISNGIDNKADTWLPPYDAAGNLNLETDIAPGEAITFTITGTLSDDAVGTIKANQASAGGETASSDEIPPLPVSLSYSKTLIETGADASCTLPSSTGSGCQYAPGAGVTYRVAVKNTGKGNAGNISVKDVLSSIRTSDGGAAFSTSGTAVVKEPADHYGISGSYSGAVGLDASVDLRPDNEIIFEVNGTVDPSATGTITNTATVNGANTNSIVLDAGTANIVATKHTDTPVYTPGGMVRYAIDITNYADSNIEIPLKDKISSFLVETANGTQQTALKDWTVTSTILSDSSNGFTDGSNAAATPANSDIDTTIKLGGRNAVAGKDEFSSVRVVITGHVRDDAIGEFHNTATVNGKLVRLAEGEIKPSPGKLVLTKTPSLDPAVYSPGETIGFVVTLQNTGDGYVTNAQLNDSLKTLLADSVGGSGKDRAFDSWTVVEDNSGLDPALTLKSNELNNSDGYQASYNIHPGQTVKLTLNGVVCSDISGDITNTATDDSGTPLSASATYTSAAAKLSIDKTVDKAEYISGDELTYTVSIKNDGGGWARDVKVTDPLSEITTTLAGGQEGKAIRMSTVSISAASTNGTSPVPPAVSHADLNQSVDIAPGDTLTYTLKAHLEPTDIADVVNTASFAYEGTTTQASATSTPAKADIALTKTAASPVYTLNEPVTWTVTLVNNTDAFASGVHIQDAISALKVVSLSGNDERAFTGWKVKTTTGNKNSVVYSPPSGANADVDTLVDLAAHDTLTFVITAMPRPTAIGDITNTATLTLDGKTSEQKATVSPQAPSWTVAKTSVQTQYEPGKPLDFLITVQNTSGSYIHDLPLKDDMSGIQAKQADGSMGPAFESGSETLSVDHLSVGSAAKPVSATAYTLDIPPHGTVVMKASAVVGPEVTGPIINTANAGGTDAVSPPVKPVHAEIEANMTVDNDYYVPGKNVVYHLVLKNVGKGIANNVHVQTRFAEAKGTWLDNSKSAAFEGWEIKADVTGADTTAGTFSRNKDISTAVDIGVGGEVHYTITPKVNVNMTTPIDVNAFFATVGGLGEIKTAVKSVAANGRPAAGTLANSNSGKLSVLDLPPVGANLVVKKSADKHEYTPDDTQIVYTLSAVNTGEGNAKDVNLADAISKLVAANGNKVFSSWTIRGAEYNRAGAVVNKLNLPANKDLSLTVGLESSSRNSFKFEVIGQINKGIDDDVTNTFTATETGGKKTSATVTTHVKRIPDNSGKLTLTKSASKNSAQVGDVVEYEVIVENANESNFKNIVVEDRYPAGFNYVDGSTEITLSGPDGEFDTADDRAINGEPTRSAMLTFPMMNIDPYTKVRIRYLLRVGMGVTFGSYTNTAVATSAGANVSNTDSATVRVEPDKVFDTASIIGKVFEDRNGDGYQADATANGIRVAVTTPLGNDYVPGSTTLKLGNKPETHVRDGRKGQPAIVNLKVGRLRGVSINRTLKETNKAVIRFTSKTRTPFDLHITTSGGSDIHFGANGKIERKSTGDVARGMSSESLNVTRNLYQKGRDYVWEITLENKGIYEDGIPGVRLITVEGIKIETDEYGRYHVPDQWVTENIGRNFLVKVDTDSLPANMEVISENPKVKRITSHALAKFNFSVKKK
ncbi:DUF11 domain-containing protein [Scandinavium goeteborgense]|uniref:DUF11 domain-containing protein n=1 Tax=Scandinavium goeteborgense TaxID=1851514 RepID=UPI002165FFD0|nr:DUF11 domain-containing protein [Scandinavium goeteborgense]MCS2153109.1 DUF11 domain-containing protein [Scandinavium goeteborgense]